MAELKDKVFIGVDGGGTSTDIIAITDKGIILGKTVGEGTNFYASNMEKARGNLKKAIDRLLQENKILDYECISIGMSSLDDEPSEEVIKVFAGEDFCPEKIEMQSDVYMALMGMTLGKPGIMIVSGTGSMAIGVDQADKLHVLGGWGYMLQDEGSAYYIAIEGIKAGIRSFEGMGEKTILEQEVVKFFKVENHRQLIEIFYNPPIQNSELAKFSIEVEKCAHQGDSVAASIIKTAIDILAKYACNLINVLGIDDCIVGMYGGVLQNSKYISSSFIQQVHATYPKARVGFPQLTPEEGAVLFAMKKRGYPITEEFLENIKKSQQI